MAVTPQSSTFSNWDLVNSKEREFVITDIGYGHIAVTPADPSFGEDHNLKIPSYSNDASANFPDHPVPQENHGSEDYGDDGRDGNPSENAEMPGKSIMDASCTLNGDGIPKLEVGMEFESDAAARAYYNTYARKKGFGIRCNKHRKSMRNGEVVSRKFVCCRQGSRRGQRAITKKNGMPRKRPDCRVGCNAMVLVTKNKSGRWEIKRVEEDHNHEMFTPRKSNYLQSMFDKCFVGMDDDDQQSTALRHNFALCRFSKLVEDVVKSADIFEEFLSDLGKLEEKYARKSKNLSLGDQNGKSVNKNATPKNISKSSNLTKNVHDPCQAETEGRENKRSISASEKTPKRPNAKKPKSDDQSNGKKIKSEKPKSGKLNGPMSMEGSAIINTIGQDNTVFPLAPVLEDLDPMTVAKGFCSLDFRGNHQFLPQSNK